MLFFATPKKEQRTASFWKLVRLAPALMIFDAGMASAKVLPKKVREQLAGGNRVDGKMLGVKRRRVQYGMDKWILLRKVMAK